MHRLDVLLASAAILLTACSRDVFATRDGEPNNVVYHRGHAYASIGAGGVRIVDPAGETVTELAPPAGADRISDLAIADELLFALDADEPGSLSVYSLADPLAPELAEGPLAVDTETFAGVSAGGGKVVVAGGTTTLQVLTYTAAGALGEAVGVVDLGAGHPDVLSAGDGQEAFVSSHFSGTSRFGVTRVATGEPPEEPRELGCLRVRGAGFTAGAGEPANFPIETALSEDGQTLLTATGVGLTLIDLTGGEPLVELAQLELPIEALSVDAHAHVAYVVGSAPVAALVSVDIADPASPAILETREIDGASALTGVAAGPEGVFVAANDLGVVVLPLSVP